MTLTAQDARARRAYRINAGHVPGIDISKWQDVDDGDDATRGDISWATMPDFVAFAILKASQGSRSGGFTDGKFSGHYDTARAHRPALKLGVYHFMTEDSSGAAQAEAFARAIDGRAMDLRHACDLEGVEDRWPDVRRGAEAALQWMHAVETLTGVRPILYSSAKNLDPIWRADEALCAELCAYDLWVTTYWNNYPRNDARPNLPKAYRKSDGAGAVVCWQWTSGTRRDKATGKRVLTRPDPDVEAWRPNKSLDQNLALDFPRWLVDGQAPPPAPVLPPSVDLEAARAYNLRQNFHRAERQTLDWDLGVDAWVHGWPERIERIAAIQREKGLEVDGKIGPQTQRAIYEP